MVIAPHQEDERNAAGRDVLGAGDHDDVGAVINQPCEEKSQVVSPETSLAFFFGVVCLIALKAASCHLPTSL